MILASHPRRPATLRHGPYDRFHPATVVACPTCAAPVEGEWQSKLGPRSLMTFREGAGILRLEVLARAHKRADGVWEGTEVLGLRSRTEQTTALRESLAPEAGRPED